MKGSEFVKGLRKEQAISICNIDDVLKLRAKDAMIKPIFVNEDDFGNDIIKKLKKEEINTCIVVTKEKKFVGMVSDEDVIGLFLNQVKYEPLTKVLESGYRREFAHRKAKELINKNKRTITYDTPINKVIETVYKQGSKYIPVVNENKKVLGVVTPSSIINLLRDR